MYVRALYIRFLCNPFRIHPLFFYHTKNKVRRARRLQVEEEFCTIRVAKIKALIRCAVTVQLICVFVFARAKIRIAHLKCNNYKKKKYGPPNMLFFAVSCIVWISNA